jgi:RNA polymerase sigma-70 factor (ECF subfamily)
VRPELHRYCARLMGSVIDGEDVVQDTLLRALVALQDLEEMPPLRPWLFRVAHNRALDLLRGRAVRAAEPMDTAPDVVDPASPDPMETLMHQQAVTTAVSRFAQLPVLQRSVVILKDVLDESLTEIAALLDLTLDAVKGHLARGRARLREINAQAGPPAPEARPASAAVARYVALFNQRDWDSLRSLLADDVKLGQSTHSLRVGRAEVGMFFTFYAQSPEVWLARRLARRPGGDRGVRRPRRGQAQLHDVARMARRPHQLHPRLPLCALRRRRRRAGAGARNLRSQRTASHHAVERNSRSASTHSPSRGVTSSTPLRRASATVRRIGSSQSW